jgi:hypothetical protein
MENKTRNTGLTSINGMIDACNHVTLDEGEFWNVDYEIHDETEIYVIGHGFYRRSSFKETSTP